MMELQHSRVGRQLESWKHVEWRTRHTELRVIHACDEGAMLITIGWHQDHVIDTVSMYHAFFGEHDQRPKLVLSLRKRTSTAVQRHFQSRPMEARTCGL